MKNVKSFRPTIWFTIFVIIPVVLSVIYYGLICSDQYISESRFVVKGRSDRPSPLSGIAGLVQGTGISSGQEQTNEVLDYIKSRSALAGLQKRIDIRDKFAASDADLFSRYPSFLRADRFENLFRYYQGKIDTKLDTETSLAILDVRAFSPADAQRINSVLLDLGEDLVNRLNAKARDKAITEAQGRVDAAEARVRNARIALSQYRNSQSIIDPLKQAGAVLTISDKLISEQAALQAQLDVMVRVAPRNPSIPALRSRVAAIGQAIAVQNGRAVGRPTALSSKMSSYDGLVLEQEFAAQTLTAANAALEQARADALRQQYYLERVVEPNAPDLSLYPSRLWNILTVIGVTLCLYLIGWMLLVGILEHAPED